LGYMELETSKVKIVNLTKYPDTIEQWDHIVSAAKLKTMLFEGLSGTYKNLLGMIPQMEKRFLHPFLSEVLYHLNTKYDPDLCIIDGCYALEGCGPVHGFPKPMKLLIFGRNCVTTDAVACHVMGMNPFDVPHLAYAYEKGYGELDIEKIQIVGESLEDVKSDFSFVPKKAFSQMRRGLKLGRYPPPVRNLGMLWFTLGNWHAGRYSSRKRLPVRRTLKNIMARNWKV